MSVKYQKIYGIKSNSQRTSISIEPENSDPTEKIKSRHPINKQLGRKTKERKAQGPRKIHKSLNTSSNSNLKVENSQKIEMN